MTMITPVSVSEIVSNLDRLAQLAPKYCSVIGDQYLLTSDHGQQFTCPRFVLTDRNSVAALPLLPVIECAVRDFRLLDNCQNSPDGNYYCTLRSVDGKAGKGKHSISVAAKLNALVDWLEP